MVMIQDTIEIKTRGEKISKWFIHLDKNYRSWHPKDHIECRYLKGSPLERGSILYFEEYIGGYLMRAKIQITNIEPNSRLEYRILFPYSLLGAKGAFIIEPHGANLLFKAKIYLGWKNPLLGKLFDKFIKIFFGRWLKSIKQHMAEEGKNLKRILEEGIQ